MSTKQESEYVERLLSVRISRRRALRGAALAAAGAALGAYGASPAPGAAEPAALAALPPGPEKQRVRGLIDLARKEGQVSWRATLIKDASARNLVEAFRIYYGLPGFNVVYDTDMFSGDFISKTNAEIGAGKMPVDLLSTGTMAFLYDLLKRSEIMRYDSPVYQAYGPAKRAGITEPGYWVADAYTFVPVWNTQLWPHGIKTWEDAVNPAFRGKISALDMTTSEISAANFLAVKSIMGADYWRRFAQLQPFLTPRAEDGVTKAASGEYPVCLGTMPSRVYQYVKKGAPVDFVLPDKGILLIPQVWAIFGKAPHPNAAKLWVDFIFSEYGQRIYQKDEALFSGRADFQPPADVAKYARPIDKLTPIQFSWKAYTPERSRAARSEFKQILEAAKAK